MNVYTTSPQPTPKDPIGGFLRALAFPLEHRTPERLTRLLRRIG